MSNGSNKHNGSEGKATEMWALKRVTVTGSLCSGLIKTVLHSLYERYFKSLSRGLGYRQ